MSPFPTAAAVDGVGVFGRAPEPVRSAERVLVGWIAVEERRLPERVGAREVEPPARSIIQIGPLHDARIPDVGGRNSGLKERLLRDAFTLGVARCGLHEVLAQLRQVAAG